MRYEFVCESCPSIRAADGKQVSCRHEIEYPMSNAPAIGLVIACPREGCCGKVTRVLSALAGVIVRGSTLADWKPGGHAHARINGRDTFFEFVDHTHTDPQARANMQRLAKQSGVTTNGIGKAYWNEKHGRYCVDVASEVPDPLGKMAKSQESHERSETTVAVKQPYKVRKPRAKRS